MSAGRAGLDARVADPRIHLPLGLIAGDAVAILELSD
jgi:hypothetical protein